MGNGSNSGSPFFNPAYFTQITKKHEPLYGEVSILCSKLVADYYIAYQTLLFTSRSLFETKKALLQSFKKTPHPNMISLLDFRVLENEPFCSCGGFLRIQVAYEYLSRTLQEDFERRQQNNRMYTEDEVRKVLLGALKGLEEVYRIKVKTGGFASMDLIVLEGTGDHIEKIKVLNPNLNRLGDLIEESEASGEDLLRIELVNLGVIACRMLTNYNYSIGEWKAKVNNKLNCCSKALRTIISKLLQGESMIKELLRLSEEQNKKNKEPLEDISSRKLNERPEESFVWKGLEIEESGTETNRLEESQRKVADVSNWDLLGDCQQQVQDVSKPIITLNYCSPDKKKTTPWDDILDFTKENQDFSKENYDFGKDFMNFSRNY